MSKKVSDLNTARQSKRQKEGWTLDEIKKNAENELKEFEGKTDKEPDELASGDMDRIIRGDDDDK